MKRRLEKKQEISLDVDKKVVMVTVIVIIVFIIAIVIAVGDTSYYNSQLY